MTRKGRRSPLAAVLVALLRVYRLVVSPLYGQTCRFYPSCSAYALAAVERHGGVRGGWLALRRLARCHPWTPGGVDHVPPAGAYRWWGRFPLDDDGRPVAAPAPRARGHRTRHRPPQDDRRPRQVARPASRGA